MHSTMLNYSLAKSRKCHNFNSMFLEHLIVYHIKSVVLGQDGMITLVSLFPVKKKKKQ